MKERFENPPLIEIVAELRWDMSAHVPEGFPSPGPLMPPILQQHEDSFANLAQKFSKLGYGNSERLIPAGYACMSHEPVLRYRFSDPEEKDKSATLYQVGPGLFTANALPPSYKSWDDFEPTVKNGIEALLSANLPFITDSKISATLRYVDAFTEELTEGKSLVDFARDTLGFRISFPKAFSDDDGVIRTQIPQVNIFHPLSFGSLQIRLAEGHLRGKRAIILEMSVEHDTKLERDPEEILAAFSEARSAIHKVFFDLTKPIHKIMKLIEA